jgi:hypothetical protein
MGEPIMKQHFIADNRRFLKLCSDMARFYGLLCLIAAGGMVALLVFLEISGSGGAEHQQRWMTTFQPFTRVPAVVLRGLLALVVAEFISYLMAGEDGPKWLLRHGHLVMYAYACILLVLTARIDFLTPTISGAAPHSPFNVGLGVFGLLSTAAVALMWVGIGITLRKVLPIIRESKTLV